MTITNTQLALDITTLVAKWNLREQEMITWISGTVGGGPTSNGKYPLTDVNDVTVDVTCPAQLQFDMDALTESARSYASAAAAAADDTEIVAGDTIQSANNAGISASLADTNATRAETARSFAQTHESNSQVYYDMFKELYLGPWLEAPLVDNKGNALLEGAFYWDTVLKAMRVWNAVSWQPF